MKKYCEKCKGRLATEIHHLFPQTKLNKKLYGDLIHDKKNLMFVCEECHKWKGVPHLTEAAFCKLLKIKPRSKTEQARLL